MSAVSGLFLLSSLGTSGLWAMNMGLCLLFSSVSALSCTNYSLAEKKTYLFLYCHCSEANWLIQNQLLSCGPKTWWPLYRICDDCRYKMTTPEIGMIISDWICYRKNTVLDPTAWGCCSSTPPNMTSNKAENKLLVGTSPESTCTLTFTCKHVWSYRSVRHIDTGAQQRQPYPVPFPSWAGGGCTPICVCVYT